MKKIISLLLISVLLVFVILNSFSQSWNVKYLTGYWEINSVSKDGNRIKNYPFNGTIDYFILNENSNSGFRKKVKPRFDGNFDVTMHQIGFDIYEEKKYLKLLSLDVIPDNSLKLVYRNKEKLIESVVKIDSMNLIIKNSDGYSYEYKRFYPKNYLNE